MQPVGVIRAIAVNVNCGGNEHTLDNLVKTKVVRVQKRGSLEFYHFPSLSVNKSTGYENSTESVGNTATTDQEHQDLRENMELTQDAMTATMCPNVFDEIGDFGGPPDTGTLALPAPPVPARPQLQVRDDLKLLAVKLTTSIKTVLKTSVRAELAIADGSVDGIDEHMNSLNENIQKATAHSSCVQFAGEFGKCLNVDMDFTSELGETLLVEGNLLEKSLTQSGKILGALIPKKEKDSPKKKGKTAATKKGAKAAKKDKPK